MERVNVVNAAGTAVATGSRIPSPPSFAGKCMMGVACNGSICVLVIFATMLWIIIRNCIAVLEFQLCKSWSVLDPNVW